MEDILNFISKEKPFVVFLVVAAVFMLLAFLSWFSDFIEKITERFSYKIADRIAERVFASIAYKISRDKTDTAKLKRSTPK